MAEAKTPLRIGDPAPDFALPDENGTVVRLADLRGKRVVIYFYPNGDCTPVKIGVYMISTRF